MNTRSFLPRAPRVTRLHCAREESCNVGPDSNIFGVIQFTKTLDFLLAYIHFKLLSSRVELPEQLQWARLVRDRRGLLLFLGVGLRRGLLAKDVSGWPGVVRQGLRGRCRSQRVRVLGGRTVQQGHWNLPLLRRLRRGGLSAVILSEQLFWKWRLHDAR